MNLDEQLAYLTKGAEETIRVGELRSKLERSARTAKPLRVKAGFDPTAPDIHLGHTVLIRKLKHFLELGGTDQKFKLRVGRTRQQEYGQEPQVIMTMPLLEGLDGKQKMSKSLGNYVGISEPPAEMFGKLMSISDDLMWRYYLLLTDLGQAEIQSMKDAVTGS